LWVIYITGGGTGAAADGGGTGAAGTSLNVLLRIPVSFVV
jgi:hypothetical protein